ncbi:hypothetical protein ACFSCX_17950 [Bacillus salitolerans]|uniref:Uncharacterized protein n=1 Tax=Bacillus salitolerans TaxID=1437434 RepID=A0ABW4LTC7_9BACI
MAKLKRLVISEDAIVDVVVPVTDEELKDRQKQYFPQFFKELCNLILK